MIRRPLFLGTLGFCGAILVSCFLGKAEALGVLVLLVLAWRWSAVRQGSAKMVAAGCDTGYGGHSA